MLWQLQTGFRLVINHIIILLFYYDLGQFYIQGLYHDLEQTPSSDFTKAQPWLTITATPNRTIISDLG